jgi:hypothetical protein
MLNILKKLPLADLVRLFWCFFVYEHRLDNFFFAVPEKYTRKYIYAEMQALCSVEKVKENIKNLGIK